MQTYLKEFKMQDCSSEIYPVYLLEQVANEIFRQCQKAVPNETLGRLLGYRCLWKQRDYIKIVDWVSGTLEAGTTYAQFTLQGLRECEIFLDERYGTCNHRPVEVGLFHSHPFGVEPYFSSTDHQTFLTFPYDKPGNVFILIDPLSHFLKVFVIAIKETGEKILEQVPWILYRPMACSISQEVDRAALKSDE